MLWKEQNQPRPGGRGAKMPRLPRRYFTHESLPDREFWYPIRNVRRLVSAGERCPFPLPALRDEICAAPRRSQDWSFVWAPCAVAWLEDADGNASRLPQAERA